MLAGIGIGFGISCLVLNLIGIVIYEEKFARLMALVTAFFSLILIYSFL